MSFPDSNRMYAVLSSFYDLFDLIFLLGFKGNPRLGLLEVIDNAGLDILDLCVGTAASSIPVAARNDLNHIYGIDISEKMLSVAQRKIERKRLTNLDVKRMPADALEFPDGSFDVVMVSFALHEFDPDLRERIFVEVSRVLKPAGRFCLIDFARQDNRLNRVFLSTWKLIEPACFEDFLGMDWSSRLTPHGLHIESEREYSFSKLYVFSKS